MCVLLSTCALGATVLGARAGTPGHALRESYDQFRQRYGQLAPRIPLSIHSVQTGARIRTEVFGTVNGDFAEVAPALSQPQGYCQFLPPLFNLKACVHYQDNGKNILRFYVGGKGYSSTFGTIRILSDLRQRARSTDFLHMQLATVGAGPHSYGYSVDIEIAPIGHKTIVRVRTDFNPNRLTRLAVTAYVHTVAENKIGFTQVVRRDGKRKYVRGMTAIIERNTVRAFFAVQAYLDTLSVPATGRYDACLRRWFDLTEEFPRQLHEMSREEYLSTKRREYLNQLRLQRRLDRRR